MCSYLQLYLWLLAPALGAVCTGTGAPVVHVIPHSHCDPGYTKTFMDYYTTDVKSILDTVVEALQEDPARRFVWEEVSFFSLWWRQASEEQKDAVRKLQSAGQLEFIGGGWVMHDEADTSMRGILNQMTEGLQFLEEELGVRPQAGWHIDPFGHSLFTPELFSLLGYRAFVLNRIPDPLKQEMKKTKGLEFFWRNPYSNHSIFAHVLDSHYSTPVILGLTTEEKAKSFADTCHKRMLWYKMAHLLIPFGNDFHFQDAPSDFKEMDEILQYIGEHQSDFDNLTVKYSTLSEYIDAVLASGASFDTRTNDFFPYIACSPCASEPCGGFVGLFSIPCGISDSFWSGFYTSKPAEKLLVREQEASLSALEQINALFPYLSSNISGSLTLARNTSALLQHHDAITGTSYPGCYADYFQRLLNALSVGGEAIAKLKRSILCGANFTKVPVLQSDSMAVLSGLTDDNIVAVVVQNTLEYDRNTYLKIPLPDNVCVKVLNGSTELISQQVGSTLYIPVQMQPLGLQVLWLKKTQCQTETQTHTVVGENVTISNGAIQLMFNTTGHLVKWTSLNSGVVHTLEQQYVQEFEKAGLDELNVCDGTNVYTFVPDDGSTVLTPKSIPTVVTATGPLIWEVKQQINSYINSTLRLYHPLDNSSTAPNIHRLFAEWQTRIGPLPSEPHNSVLSQITTGAAIPNFTTYSSGYYPVIRQHNSSAPLQANTFPLVGRAHFSQDSSSTDFAVISLRPMALSSTPNSLLLMLHRRIKLLLDARGDDTSVMDDPILIGFIDNASVPVKTVQGMREHQNPPVLHFALLNSTNDWNNFCSSKWTTLHASLPQSVQLHSMRLLNQYPAMTFDVGIRLINTDEQDPQLADIGSLFAGWKFLNWRETTPDFLRNVTATVQTGVPSDPVIKLLPLQLRSLVLQIQTRSL